MRKLFTIIAMSASVANAQSSTGRIVGIGAASCPEFLDNIQKTPAMQRDYLAWAQGFMSGILLSRPAGVDEGLALLPPNFGLGEQLGFLRQYCSQNRSGDFPDAVVALYRALRTAGK